MTKGIQSFAQIARNETMSLAAAWPMESHTAVTNRDHSHDLSSSLTDTGTESIETRLSGEGLYNDSGEEERMCKDSVRL